MNKLIAILAFILIMPFAFAQESIYSGEVTTDTDIDIEGKSFRFSYDEPSEKIFAQNPSLNMIIGLYDCKVNSFYKICINKANFSHKNTTTYRNYYLLDVDIYEFDYGIKFNSTYPDSMLQNEKQPFSFSFVNPTTLEMPDFYINLPMPNFTVKNLKGCDFDGLVLSWKGSMPASYYKSCSMDLISQVEGTFSLLADVNYTLGFQKISRQENLGAIKVLPAQLELVVQHSKNLEITEDFEFNISLSNSNSQDMDVKASIELPKGAYFSKEKPKNFDSSTGFLKESFIIRAGQSKDYFFKLKSDKEITVPFDMHFTYFLNGIENSFFNSTFVSVSEPKPQISLLADPKNATPNQKITVVAKVTNPGRIFDLTELSARVASKIQNSVSSQLNSLKPNESYTMISHSVILPNDAYANYSLDVELSYSINGNPRKITQSSFIKIINGTAPVKNPELQNPSNSASNSSLTEHFGNDAESQFLKIAQPADPETESALQDLAFAFSSFEDISTFQKIMAVFGLIMVISTLTIFTILHRFKAKKLQKQKENVDILRKQL